MSGRHLYRKHPSLWPRIVMQNMHPAIIQSCLSPPAKYDHCKKGRPGRPPGGRLSHQEMYMPHCGLSQQPIVLPAPSENTYCFDNAQGCLSITPALESQPPAHLNAAIVSGDLLLRLRVYYLHFQRHFPTVFVGFVHCFTVEQIRLCSVRL